MSRYVPTFFIFKKIFIMNKLLTVFAFALSFALAGCGSAPTSDAEMAAKYGMTMEEYQEQKEAAARMNMSVEDHLKHGTMDMDDMDMMDMSH